MQLAIDAFLRTPSRPFLIAFQESFNYAHATWYQELMRKFILRFFIFDHLRIRQNLSNRIKF